MRVRRADFMATRRMALFLWLATPLWVAAQSNAVSHGGPTFNNYGTNSQSGPNAYQTPPGTVTINGATNQVVTASSATANGANATLPSGPSPNIVSGAAAPEPSATPLLPAAPAAAAPAAMTPVSTSGPDISAVPLSSDPDQIDNDKKNELEPGDQFIYQVVEDQQPPKILLVNEGGYVNIPFLPKPIKAEGLTLRQVHQALQDRLTDKNLGPDDHPLDFYKTATIKVALYHSDQSRGHVIVYGAVMRPALVVPVPNDSLLTLAEAIRAAGGYTTNADLKSVYIIHQTEVPDQPTKITVDVNALVQKGKEPDNILSPGDTVTVPSDHGDQWLCDRFRRNPGPARLEDPAARQRAVYGLRRHP